MQSTWLSVHFFHAGDHDQLLQLLIRPVVQQAGCPYFFIRYWEGGPHIRLRLYVENGWQAEVKRLLEDIARIYFATYPTHRQDATYPLQQLQPNDSWQYIPYVPEIDRYGNVHTMSLAEQQFHLSSVYVLQEINPAAALTQAIRMNLALLQALQLTPALTLDICHRFIQGWLPRLFLPEQDRQQQEDYYLQRMQEKYLVYAPALTHAAVNLWQEIAQGNAPSALQIFADGNLDVFTQYRQLGFRESQLAAVAGSFLHMGHNRLGVSNLDEAYIMYFTRKCLEHIYGIP
ncbi:hypothetical protein HHL17_28000 [Chitinophaga sp. G-6-1-13]|uniref:Thiopeptide-type bacteriocin biosynthesis domain-containing protein n=1 Tax=Chitinophaga fulva TaxID=2728842 RepID=A0A848GUQ2_9BACT|nr:thiopeptide-type bacteriocin biosynthesis protein [Chitinophaga fulva]NML41069.1 hypothetical protein [Chitinophaga fulva]